MTGFIRKAACRGRRPARFRSYRYYERPNLIARMLKERAVARFLVAPNGYGKSTLVLDYAHTVFGYDGVFWVNGASPCFLRDLDDGVLASGVFEADPHARLVVFDDVPVLDGERAQLLSGQMNSLIDKGCEVVATMVPSADAYAALQRDRMRLSGSDLLLSDEEIQYDRPWTAEGMMVGGPLPREMRVAALVWAGDADGLARFCSDALAEELPADALLAMASMLAVSQGPIEGLRSGLGIGFEAFAQLSEGYPHLGIDAQAGTFCTCAIGADALMKGTKARAGEIVGRAGRSDIDGLVCLWADCALENGDARRACALVCSGCSGSTRAQWAGDHDERLLDCGALADACALAAGARTGNPALRARVALLEAVCRFALGDAAKGIALAKRFAFDASVGAYERRGFLTLLARHVPGALGDRACEALGKISSSQGAPGKPLRFWDALSCAALEARSGDDRLGACWMALASGPREEVDCKALCVMAIWLLDGARKGQADGATGARPIPEDLVEAFGELVRACLSSEAPHPGFFAKSFALTWERARMAGVLPGSRPLGSQMLMTLHGFEMAMTAEKHRYEEQLAQGTDGRAGEGAASANGPMRAVNAMPALVVPPLTLHLFGRFEAFIGNDRVNLDATHRNRVKLLLMLLAVNRGRESHRDGLTAALWPKSDPLVARRNLYSLWSQLRRTLALPDGSCPYAICSDESFSLDARLVRTDLDRLSAICRDLLFGEIDIRALSDLYTELDLDFANELLPSERENPTIVRARADCKSRLVEALVAVTRRLIDAGEPQWGVWFARMALYHDMLREDAYFALMEAQVASGQRTAAMMTFLECRRALRDELGVDPSPELSGLYGRLLEAEGGVPVRGERRAASEGKKAKQPLRERRVAERRAQTE